MMRTVRLHRSLCLIVLAGAFPPHGAMAAASVHVSRSRRLDVCRWTLLSTGRTISGSTSMVPRICSCIYGFEQLECATYRTPSGEEVRAEVYRHADACECVRHVFAGALSGECCGGLGNEGCADAGHDERRHRPVVSQDVGAAVCASRGSVAPSLVLRSLHWDRRADFRLSLLCSPSEGRVPRSEQYHRARLSRVWLSLPRVPGPLRKRGRGAGLSHPDRLSRCRGTDPCLVHPRSRREGTPRRPFDDTSDRSPPWGDRPRSPGLGCVWHPWIR